MRKHAFLMMLFVGITIFGAGLYSAHTQAQANKKQPSGNTSSEQQASEKPYGKKKVTIKPGDTLSKIGKRNDTTYTRLFNANKSIEDPDVIYPGDKVRIPHPEEKLPNRAISRPQPVSAPTDSYVAPAAAPATSVDGGVWDRLAACESGGNWSINTGNGYYGGLQFDLGTWQSNGGTGYPHQASKAEQIRVAENLRAARGFSPWPACSAQLGLR